LTKNACKEVLEECAWDKHVEWILEGMEKKVVGKFKDGDFTMLGNLLHSLLYKDTLFTELPLVELRKNFERFQQLREEMGDRIKLPYNSEDYYIFLDIIGRTVYSFNRFVSSFLVMLEKTNSQEEIRPFSRFVRYANAMVTTNVRKYFFRELPASSKNFPTLYFDSYILDTGTLLFLRQDKKWKELICPSVKLLFYMYLMFSFIYKTHKDNQGIDGVFLRFSLNREKFLKFTDFTVSALEAALKSERVEENARKIFKNIRSYVVAMLLEKELKIPEEPFWKEKLDVYEKFYEEHKYVRAEPFSWWIAGFLRKLDGAFQDTDEYFSTNERRKLMNFIIKELINSLERAKKHISNHYPESLGVFIENNSIYFALYNSFADFISERVWEDLLHHRDKGEFLSFTQASSLEVNIKPTDTNLSNLSWKALKSRLEGLSINEENLKLKSLITMLSPGEFMKLVSSYLKNVGNYYDDIKNSELVGIYTSGVFLGHLVNLYLELNKKVWLFKVYPHALTHPVHKDERHSFVISLFDESVKTLFSISVYENYLLRNTHTPQHLFRIYPLFDFGNYRKLNLNVNLEIFPFIKYDNVHFSVRRTNDIEIKFPLYTFQELQFILSQIIDSFQRSGKINLYDLLIDSKFTVSFGYYFAKTIKERYKGKKVFFFPYSSEGEILALATSLFLASEGISVAFVDVVLPEKEDLVVGVDISMDTGFTKRYAITKAKYVYGLKKFPDIELFILGKKGERWKAFQFPMNQH